MKYRFIPATHKGIELTMLALLGGLLIILQLVLPATALASSARITTSSPPPKDLAFARAEVSVVRLVVSYTTTSPRAASSVPTPSPTNTAKGRSATAGIQCTGLGVLVGSWPLNGNNTGPYTNWVLTASQLLSPTQAVCAPGQRLSIASIDVYPNTAYTNNASNVQPLGTLPCQVTPSPCTTGTPGDYISVNIGGAILFPFTSTAPQPFVDIAAPNVTPHLTIQLNNATGALPQLPPVPTTVNQAQNFLTPTSPSTDKSTLELGTPTVDITGALVGVDVQTGTIPVPQASTLLQQLPPQPTRSRTNPLQDNWNKGIDAFYRTPPDTVTAIKELDIPATINPTFQAAIPFEQALGKGPGQGAPPPSASPTVGTGPTLVPTATTTTISYPSFFGIPLPLIVIGSVVLLALIVLLVVVASLVRSRRAHQRELERFEVEQQEAEKEAQRLQQAQAQAAQVAPPVNMGSTPRPTSLPCSNCRQLVRVDSPSCPNCHYLLTPSPSGKLLTARPPTMAETPPRALNIPAPSPPELSIPQLQHVLPLQQSAASAHSPATTTHAVTASDLRCPNCGLFTRVGATYCPNCRYRLSSPASTPQLHAIATPAPASASPDSGGSSGHQEQEAFVEATPGNASVEARLRRLWSQLG